MIKKQITFACMLILSNTIAKADINVFALNPSSAADIVGDGSIDSIMSAAASYWNKITNGKINVTINYGYGSITEVSEHIPIINRINFSRSAPWFADGTPLDHSEFSYVAVAVNDFGGGIVTSGRTMSGGPAGRYDMFTIALHEIGHAIGYDGFSGETFDLTAGTYSGSSIPLDRDNEHLRIDSGLDGALMTARSGLGDRILPSAIEIALLEEKLDLTNQFDKQAIYFTGNTQISNTNISPVGKDVFNPASINISGPLSGISFTDLERTVFFGDLSMENRSQFEIVNGGVATINGEISIDDSRFSVRQNGVVITKNLIAENNSVINVEGALFLNPRSSLFQPENSMLFIESTLNMIGSDAILSARTGNIVFDNSTLVGIGNIIAGDVIFNDSLLSPGASPGEISITGDFTFNSGTLRLEDYGTEKDVLNITGDVFIGSDTNIELFFSELSIAEIIFDDFFTQSKPTYDIDFASLVMLSLFTTDVDRVGSAVNVFFGAESKMVVAEFDPSLVSSVPLPAGLPLFLTGLIGLWVAVNRKRVLVV